VLAWPWHRIYGPQRLPALLGGFRLVGRVWDGQVVRGKSLEAEPNLFQDVCDLVSGPPKPGQLKAGWQHQQVLVLAPSASEAGDGTRSMARPHEPPHDTYRAA
jgi:hypothetical protein